MRQGACLIEMRHMPHLTSSSVQASLISASDKKTANICLDRVTHHVVVDTFRIACPAQNHHKMATRRSRLRLREVGHVQVFVCSVSQNRSLEWPTTLQGCFAVTCDFFVAFRVSRYDAPPAWDRLFALRQQRSLKSNFDGETWPLGRVGAVASAPQRRLRRHYRSTSHSAPQRLPFLRSILHGQYRHRQLDGTSSTVR